MTALAAPFLGRFRALPRTRVRARRRALLLVLAAAAGLAALVFPGMADGKRCRRYGDRMVELKFPDSGRVWIPEEARCGGSFDVIVLLHGNNASRARHKSLGGGRHLERWARRYLNRKLIRPVILAEPVHFAACASKEGRAGLPFLYGDTFDMAKYRRLLESLLRRRGIRVRSWSFLGHSGAGCCLSMGLFRVHDVWPKVKIWASADTCYREGIYAAKVKRDFGDRPRTKVINACRGLRGYRGYKRYERELLTRQARGFKCDGRHYESCRRHPTRPWFSMVTRAGYDHSRVVVELFKTLVFQEFPSRRRVRRRIALARRRHPRTRRRRAHRRRAHRQRTRRARQRWVAAAR